MALLKDQIEEAKVIYYRAAKVLGPNLGGFAITDLLADNTNWSLRNIDDVVVCLGTNITQHFPQVMQRINHKGRCYEDHS